MTNPFQQGAPQPGDLIGGKYIIERRLGEGGFSWVYAAQHVDIESLHVAIKVLKQRQAENPSVVRRFKREAVATASLRSQHTVRVMDYGDTAEGHPYLVMELVDGVALDRLIRANRRLRPTDVARLTLGILRALIEAHSNGIIHRDLKPANVFVAAEKGVRHPVSKVLDFGIAKIVGGGQFAAQGAADHTVAGLVFCTPEYASPELLRGMPALASDLYAAGILMIEMLEGRPPWSLDNAVLTSAKHLGNEPVPLGPYCEKSGLAHIIRKAVAKPLGQRFASAVEMADALDEAYFALGVSPRSESPIDLEAGKHAPASEAVTHETPVQPAIAAAESNAHRMAPVNSGAAMLRATRESGLVDLDMEPDTEEVPYQDIMDAVEEADEDLDASVVLDDSFGGSGDLTPLPSELDDLDASLREIEERIVELHTAKNWVGLARNYRMLLRRLADAPGREYAELRLTVFVHLAGLYDRTLHRQSEALHMYIAAAANGATERDVTQRITGLRNSLRFSYPRKRIKPLIRRDWFDVAEVRQTFIDRRAVGDLDGAWCAAAPLVLSDQADDDEYALYHDLRPTRMGLPSRPLTDEDWSAIEVRDHNDALRRFLGSLDDHLRDMFARSLAEIGLDLEKDAFAKRDRRGLADIMEFCAQVLNVAKPSLVFDPTSEGVRNANVTPPALLIGADIGGAKPSRTVTFRLARGVAQLRPEYYLAFGTRTPHELLMFLNGTLEAIRALGRTDGARHQAFFRRLIRTIPRKPRAALAELASEIGVIDEETVSRLLVSAEAMSNRVGLLICGDLRASIKGLAVEHQPLGGASLGERAKALIAFSISEPYMGLRHDLGLTVVR